MNPVGIKIKHNRVIDLVLINRLLFFTTWCPTDLILAHDRPQVQFQIGESAGFKSDTTAIDKLRL